MTPATPLSPAAATVVVPVHRRVADLAAAHIGAWQQGYLQDRPQAVAALARLRRGAGREAGQMPDLWSLIDTDPLHTRPEGTRPLSEVELVRAENALHAACTLWAFHQQSRTTPMHRRHSRERPGGLGAAVRRLMPADGTDEAVRKRLVRAGTAPTWSRSPSGCVTSSPCCAATTSRSTMPSWPASSTPGSGLTGPPPSAARGAVPSTSSDRPGRPRTRTPPRTVNKDAL